MEILSLILSYWPSAIAIAAVFSALVFVHEFGHYSVARLCGVRIEVFSIGFGWEVFGWNDSHGTRWKVCAVPLGGYVKMFGDEDAASAGKKKDLTPEEEAEAFHNKSLWKRAAVVIAGPAINYIFAIVLLFGLYVTVGKPYVPPVVNAVIAGSAADKVGIKPYDTIVSIDGKDIKSFGDIQRTMMLARGEEKSVTILRDNKEINFKMSPQIEKTEDSLGFSSSRVLLGVVGADSAFAINKIKISNGGDVCDSLGKSVKISVEGQSEQFIIKPLLENNKDCANSDILSTSDLTKAKPQRLSIVNAISAASVRTWEANATILASFKQIFTGARSATELGGIIRIGSVISSVSEKGLPALIALTAFLSITLGLINLFPIPMLDGGHLLFYAIEAIIRRPVPEKIQDWAFQAGFIFIIGVMIFTNLNDIVQLIF